MSSAPSSTNGEYSSRRDIQSTSSAHSSRSERNPDSHAHPAVESAVTRLLVSIKQLLEALTRWSELKVDEVYVSDVYVRLGNDFNAAVAAFAAFNIDMSELLSVPDDLRVVLEQCLAEDATPDNLALFLPTVRQIITNLLQGLRGKQSAYRRVVADQKRRSEHGERDRSEHRSSRRQRGESGSAHQRQPSSSYPNEPEPQPSANRDLRRSVNSKRSRPATSTSSNQAPASENFVGGFSPEVIDGAQDATIVQHNHSGSISHRRHKSTLSLGGDGYDGGRDGSTPEQAIPPEDPTPIPLTPPTAPAHVKRYSLVDRPVPSSPPPPPTIIETPAPLQENSMENSITPTPSAPSTPPYQLPPLPDESVPTPGIANSLAALENRGVLERRASKRFSTYNISKIAGNSPNLRDRSTKTTHNRRSFAASNALTPGDLAVLTEEEDHSEKQLLPTRRPSLRRDHSSRGRRPVTPEGGVASAVPPSTGRGQDGMLAATDARLQSSTPVIQEEDEPATGSDDAPLQDQVSESPSQFPVFLQLGREVKKVLIEPGLTFSSLRVLFVDKFSYNPGQENFPAIYIRDPSSGVQYELEDVEEVKERCLLSLNIEPLDQIKQHIDFQISSLAQDIKDLRSVVTTNNYRHSAHVSEAPSFLALAESTPPTRPTDQQFRHVAGKLSHFMQKSSKDPSAFETPSKTPTQILPQTTGTSVASEYTSRVVADLKIQFDEVQHLRRDLGVMKQLYTDFMKSTKESLGSLRSQTTAVKQLANTKIGGARAYIDTGKQQLDLRSQTVLTEVEKLQDIAEAVRDDVTKRQITPKPQYLKSVKQEIDSCATELESLRQYINTVKPMWKKTWEEELQNIVEEQGFLMHQEEFLADLLDDHKALAEVFGHVEKVISLRNSGSRNRTGATYRPPPPEEGHGGLNSVLREIRGGGVVDSSKILRTIEENQKNRKKELASRTDEMHAELSEFVGAKKLRMTGGTEETERVRQRKNDLSLKAMFNNQGSISPSPSGLPMVNSTSLSFAAARDLPPSPSP